MRTRASDRTGIPGRFNACEPLWALLVRGLGDCQSSVFGELLNQFAEVFPAFWYADLGGVGGHLRFGLACMLKRAVRAGLCPVSLEL